MSVFLGISRALQTSSVFLPRPTRNSPRRPAAYWRTWSEKTADAAGPQVLGAPWARGSLVRRSHSQPGRAVSVAQASGLLPMKRFRPPLEGKRLADPLAR